MMKSTFASNPGPGSYMESIHEEHSKIIKGVGAKIGSENRFTNENPFYKRSMQIIEIYYKLPFI